MPEGQIVDRFSCASRTFHVTSGRFPSEGTEFLQLNEVVTVKRASSTFFKTDGSLTKTVPLLFASRSTHDPEVQVSMHYEGLPIEILKRFLVLVSGRWEV